MLRNYLKIAFRNLFKNKIYSFINIAGLAVGLTGFILISIFLKNELSYDRYNTKADRIFRVVEIQNQPGTGVMKVAVTMGPLAPALKQYFPQIENSARMVPVGTSLCKVDDKDFYERYISFADPSLFRIFTYPLIEGNSVTALVEPFSVVLTESLAKKYFPSGNAMGRSISIDYGFGLQQYKITGIIKDCPPNSHNYFEMLCSFKSLTGSVKWLKDWGSNLLATFVLLKDPKSSATINAEFPKFVKSVIPNESGDSLHLYLQPLLQIHLNSSDIKYQTYNYNSGSISTVYIFTIIAFFILLIACINFMNLSTARSSKRIKEIGMRKVLGSTRKELIYQFLGESIIISLIAFFFSMLLTELAFPAFKNIFQERIIYSYQDNIGFLLEILGITFLVGIIAGSYPAFFLSRFQPARSLKNQNPSTASGAFFRKILVVLQFTVAVALIVCTEIVSNQMKFISDKDIGFNKEHLLYIPIRGQNALEKIPLLKTELLKNANIVSTAAGSGLTGASGQDGKETVVGTNGQEQMDMTRSFVDFDYINTMQMKIVEGRGFSKDIPSDSSAVLINETAVRKFGWKNPIGKQFEGKPVKTVIGVVKDFNFSSLHQEIDPLIMEIDPQQFEYILVRIRPGDIQNTIEYIGETWKEIIPGEPFDYSFLNQYLDKVYKSDTREGQIFESFSFLAILIACLGLFGLAAFTAEQRTKEIGIRKILGASVNNIVLLLSFDFLKLVILAGIMAVPVSYYVMNKWLEEFVYKVNIGAMVFISAGLLALMISFITIGFQAVKASTANPVKALRYE